MWRRSHLLLHRSGRTLWPLLLRRQRHGAVPLHEAAELSDSIPGARRGREQALDEAELSLPTASSLPLLGHVPRYDCRLLSRSRRCNLEAYPAHVVVLLLLVVARRAVRYLYVHASVLRTGRVQCGAVLGAVASII